MRIVKRERGSSTSEVAVWLKDTPKTYVSVNVDIDEDGTMLPRLIRWMNGRVFAIEQLGYKCRASSAKVGGGGIRYTVRINGRETYLFQEGSRWFVEARAKSRPRQAGL